MLERYNPVSTPVTETTRAAMFNAVRAHSITLSRPLSAEDAGAQSMADASPVKWHLAHTTWFFETFILEAFDPDFRPFNPAFRILFNSYYNGIGEKYTRAQRGMLTRPSLAEVLAYRRDVDSRMEKFLETAPEPGILQLVELGLQHEQQHQELIVTDTKHLFSLNPLYPAYGLDLEHLDAASNGLNWLEFSAGVVEIGHDGNDFCFDNETPKHREFTEIFSMASRLVTNGEYCEFIEQGGYRNPAYWLSEGWNWVQSHQSEHPLYWQRDGKQWREFTLEGLQPLQMQDAILHVSYFEAAAYAAWAGARLPTEAEWEVAATTSDQVEQMFGVAWQWTSSAYAAYPGFSPAAGAVGEYNGKFMVNQYVLRGSSLATPDGHSRPSYRNFFPADARWQFSGIRLAK
jgi:ergothioneine biosynthesis protein EgtB